MTQTPDALSSELAAKAMEILDENRTMCVATLRPDGWPQATIVGFIHDAFDLYFVIAQDSQKLANLLRDPRASLAIGAAPTDKRPVHGLSMSALVERITSPAEVERINGLIAEHYPRLSLFAPAAVSTALMRATPQIMSIIDYAGGQGHRTKVEVSVDRHYQLKVIE